jgi:hypothetical protein
MRGLYEIVRDGKVQGRREMDDRLARRLKGVRRVADAPPKPEPIPPLWRRVVSYLLAVWSLYTKGPVARSMQAARLLVCRSCEHHQQIEGRGEFCKRCGCGTSSRAELTVKTAMPAAKCPLGKWDR